MEERRKEVVNQALVRLCKEKDRVWKNLIKTLPKLIEEFQWTRLCDLTKYDTRVVEEIRKFHLE
jgi:hypothetical protein